MSQRFVLLLAVATVAFAIGFYWGQRPVGPERGESRTADVGPCSVTRVVDGDTVWVECGGWRAPCAKWPRVRLLNIDTPERGQPGYEEATAALREMVLGRNVSLVFDRPGDPTCGGHGRLLAYLVVDGVNVNVEMVRRGWSDSESKYGKGRFAGEFEAAERARERISTKLK